ncbi:unnamed protein product [Brassicogethes aeneus]|uniref:Ig-like domain-containing protein n=1 Tax=Brassicogethes aeneus TaxID=1431903 RepID=A0A9P0AS84_BRAAE|nr:unnamed protein product [Brassicogethes aeneus]
MDTLGFLTLLSCLTLAFSKLVIEEIRGPESIQNGTTDVVVLDCVYDAKQEPNLVLKWFFNSPSDVIYQWIPPYQPKTKKSDSNIDTHFNVTSDKSTMYRALKISNVDTSMTGNYTCKVSSDDNEAYMTKQLIIYIPAKSGLAMAIYPEESAVSCSTFGVFPKPEIEITVTGNGTHIIDDEEIVVEDEDGLFNVTKIFRFNNETIVNTIMFTCNMSIPGTEYTEVKSLNHSIENSAISSYFSPTPCATILTILLFYLVK